MKKETVQIRAALSQIIERQKEEPKLPVQNEANGDGRPQDRNLGNPPTGIDAVLSFNFAVDRFRIFPEIT